MSPEAAPRTVRVAGVLTTAQALAGLVFVGAVVVRSFSGDSGGVGRFAPGQTLGEAGYFAVLAVGVLAAGIGLWRGKHWARTPALLVQLLLLGVAWYAMGPSDQPWLGMALAVPAVAVLYFLFNRSGRPWSLRGGVDRESG